MSEYTSAAAQTFTDRHRDGSPSDTSDGASFAAFGTRRASSAPADLGLRHLRGGGLFVSLQGAYACDFAKQTCSSERDSIPTPPRSAFNSCACSPPLKRFFLLMVGTSDVHIRHFLHRRWPHLITSVSNSSILRCYRLFSAAIASCARLFSVSTSVAASCVSKSAQMHLSGPLITAQNKGGAQTACISMFQDLHNAPLCSLATQ